MSNGNFAGNLANHIGQTVTIFTTSGGESGRGFTGVLATVNCDFVRLVDQIGPAPGCALGNCCDKHFGSDQGGTLPNGISCNGNRGFGAIVDIPIDRIASFVHNTVGSNW
jgi:hypothetical protein